MSSFRVNLYNNLSQFIRILKRTFLLRNYFYTFLDNLIDLDQGGIAVVF